MQQAANGQYFPETEANAKEFALGVKHASLEHQICHMPYLLQPPSHKAALFQLVTRTIYLVAGSPATCNTCFME